MSVSCCFMYFLVIFSSVSFASSASFSGMEHDIMTLLALRDEFTLGGTLPNDNALNSWNSSLHFCDQKGIKCGRRHKRVTVLYLVDQKLNGAISPLIGNLSFLRVLYLSNNSLCGEIPKQIGYLRRLQYLDLQGNSFRGRIPTELSNCSNLIWLNLGSNGLTGRIPFQLRSLSKMTTLYVDKNYLVGEMPTFLMNLTSLTRFSVGYNNLHGDLKDSLQGLSKLTDLSLMENNFIGTISSLYNLSSLEVLEIDRNNFTGTLVRDIDVAFPKLMWFSLDSNGFTGTIPSTLPNISGLSVLQMNLNKFTGRIPDNLGNLKSLRILVCTGNNLGGLDNDLSFISSLTKCTKLERFVIEDNRFSGPIPESVGNFSSNLWLLGMGENYITGSIPETIGELSGLSWVSLGRNLLSGTIPDSIGKLASISIMSLSGNNLHGEIPSSIGKLTNLIELDLSRNSLDGSIPPTFRNCKSVQKIDISSNRFGGTLLGDVFSQIQNLHYCNLSHNSFEGRFPVVFGKLRTLNTLDVSYNNFIGEVPAQLGESLEFLSMAGNSFQGNVPASLGNLRGLIWLDLSSNNLSGLVSKELASLPLLQNLNLSFNQLEGEVPLFKNVSVVSIVGNKKLCGRNPGLQLRPCLLPRKRKIISKEVIIVAAVTIAALACLFVLLLIFFYCRRKHTLQNVDGLANRYRRITYAELFKATEGFSESNLIGTGSFGDVFKGNLDDESKPVAVKVLKLSKYGATRSFIAECKVLRSIRHRNLLRIKTSCSSLDHKGNEFMALVFNFMSNGNLDNWLHINHDQGARVPLSLEKRLQIALDVGCALNYLHNCCEPPIIHCDLKPSNILLDDDMVAHVGDFGLAKLLYSVTDNMSEGESLSAAVRGTVGYVAPEYGMGATISPQGDIYSYGILLLELITGRRPTSEMFNNEINLRSFIERALPDHIEEVVDECLVNELNEAMAVQSNPEQYKLQWRTSLVSFVEVGISCSAESSKERMDVQCAVNCLMKIKH